MSHFLKIDKNRIVPKNSRQTSPLRRIARLSDKNIKNYTLKMVTSGFIAENRVKPEVSEKS